MRGKGSRAETEHEDRGRAERVLSSQIAPLRDDGRVPHQTRLCRSVRREKALRSDMEILLIGLFLVAGMIFRLHTTPPQFKAAREVRDQNYTKDKYPDSTCSAGDTLRSGHMSFNMSFNFPIVCFETLGTLIWMCRHTGRSVTW